MNEMACSSKFAGSAGEVRLARVAGENLVLVAVERDEPVHECPHVVEVRVENVGTIGVDFDAAFGVGFTAHVAAGNRAALEHEHLPALLGQHARDRASPDAGPGHDDVDFLHGHSIP